eukprot:Nitzschia sp. Nitz4//scaffold105_size73764//27232//28413//NITZ4_005674-RA/size73764-processed-gene-0.16-mRNA-1//-1//CDS//3329532441//6942//frame0
MSPNTPLSENVNNGRGWNVWTAIDQLEQVKDTFYPDLTPRVIPILQHWADKWAGDPEWRSILNKAALHKELEESIVAIHFLLRSLTTDSKIIVMDICAGKGLFSFLLSYLKPPQVSEIIMLEKAAINWYHITNGANPTCKEEGRPFIHIWGNTNLHDYDSVLDRILALPLPVAMTGIHLCKQLGPSFCGLVNGLASKCIYACLAPCCMPRAVTTQKGITEADRKSDPKAFTLAVQLYENDEKRHERKEYMERRGRIKKKPRGGPCFHCHDETHGFIDCPIVPTLPPLEQVRIRRSFHAATIPCWNCLTIGHYKNACPEAVVRSTPLSLQPPVWELDVSRVLDAERPYNSYCYLLAEAFQDRSCMVVETDLENTEKHQDGNWNSERKSVFILAT